MNKGLLDVIVYFIVFFCYNYKQQAVYMGDRILEPNMREVNSRLLITAWVIFGKLLNLSEL